MSQTHKERRAELLRAAILREVDKALTQKKERKKISLTARFDPKRQMQKVALLGVSQLVEQINADTVDEWIALLWDATNRVQDELEIIEDATHETPRLAAVADSTPTTKTA